MYVWGATSQLYSDQVLRLLCLKVHVRVRDSTLWRYCWQEARKFLCTKIPLFEGVEQPKNSLDRKCFLRRATNVMFSIFRGWRRKKLPRSAQLFQTVFRVVSMNQSIRITSGPKILRICILHCYLRDSMLRQNCWKEAREFLCSKIPRWRRFFLLIWEVQQLWTSPKNFGPRNAFSDALLISESCFQKTAAGAAKK